jgi:hypothetical protein
MTANNLPGNLGPQGSDSEALLMDELWGHDTIEIGNNLELSLKVLSSQIVLDAESQRKLIRLASDLKIMSQE